MSNALNFQDFGIGQSNADEFDSPFTNNSVNSNYDRRNTEKEAANLVDGSEVESTAGNKHSFLSFKFYQQYFDVDTEQVYSRILNSAIPKKDCNFIRDHLQPSPDLYGPFWICVTLVFVAAIFGNFSHYIESLGEDLYANDFKLVTGISTIVMLYVLFVPLAIYVTLYYRNAPVQYGYLDIVALYGYSLSIFIPVSILWIFHYQVFRWALIFVSVFLSGYVLATTIWEAVKADKNKLVAFGIIFGVLFFHSALAIGMKELYFDTILPAKQEQNTKPEIKTTILPLVADNAPAENKLKADALKAPPDAAKSPKKEDPKVEVKQAAKDSPVEVKLAAADQKVEAKAEKKTAQDANQTNAKS